MADPTKYIIENGVVSADTSEILSNIQDRWRDVFGTALSLDANTPQGRIIELQASEDKNLVETCALVANQINPNYAIGQFLDALAAIFGVARFAATKTVVLATLSGVPGTIVPAGLIVKNTAGNRFKTNSEVTIGSTGSVPGIAFYAEEAGAIPCPANTLTEIVTTTPGLETVNNPAAQYVLGESREADDDFRARMIGSRYSRTSLEGAIKAAINAIPNVVDYWFYNNGEGSVETIKSVDVDPHSVILVIEGGDNTAIADALMNTRSAGCGFTAIPGQSVAVDIPTGNAGFNVVQTITFNRPVKVPVDMEISVRRKHYAGSDSELEGDVNAALEALFSGKVEKVDAPHIGGTLYAYEIGAAISEQIPEIAIQDVKIAPQGETPTNTAISTTAAELVTIGSTITVTIND